MAVPKIVQDLVAAFQNNQDEYRASGFKETPLRIEFVNPFFEALGWDVANKSRASLHQKSVIHEFSQRAGNSHQAPDYAFLVNRQIKFFVETKKPSVKISEADDAAYQLRRYGWSAKLPISILTDFEQFAVYDCRHRPDKNDTAATARIDIWGCDEFVRNWSKIESIFGYQNVINGSLDKYADAAKSKKGTEQVDEAFLDEIEKWRAALARNIALRNPDIEIGQLNSAVQRTIDRIIFLRIAEARGFEQEGNLKALIGGSNIYGELAKRFVAADKRYNSGLFHFDSKDKSAEELDKRTLKLAIDDKPLKDILENLYYPKSPYEFSVMPADVLGQVYEQFLGKIIKLSGKSAKVEEKPEVRKAGGVYYTPTYIVQSIVETTLASLLKGKTAAQVRGIGDSKKHFEPLRVVDPACGSGSFLVEAYQYLLDWYRDQYIDDHAERHSKGKSPKLYLTQTKDWRLTVEEKKQILLAHIFGVDIDAQAVEVTKLSLLLKVLEGERDDKLASQMDFFRERVLPDLGNNIKCGNSLIENDFHTGSLFNDEDAPRIKAFDWSDEFLFLGKSGGFDAIVGNPPYIDSEWMTKHWPNERRYCSNKYEYAKGNWDIFCVFVGRTIELLKTGGVLSFIVPNKLMTATYARATRKFILHHGTVLSINDYSSIRVFPVAVYPMVFVFQKGVSGSTRYEKMEYDETGSIASNQAMTVSLNGLSAGDEWQFSTEDTDVFSDGNLIALGKVAKINDAATVAQAYELKKLLSDKKRASGSDLKLINSGTIDPYVSLWGIRSTRYIKQAYEYPVLEASRAGRYAHERVRQAGISKILVANMTKRLEAVVDLNGEYLAGKSVNVIETDYDLCVLGAILNSRLISEYYERRFHGKKLSGGYLQVAPANLKQIPVPARIPSSTTKEIGNLVARLIKQKHQEVSASDEQTREAAKRLAKALYEKIEQQVRELYGVTGNKK